MKIYHFMIERNSIEKMNENLKENVSRRRKRRFSKQCKDQVDSLWSLLKNKKPLNTSI